jgi:hypothetical protein
MEMLTDTSVQALLAGGLPAGTRWFLVAAIPVEGPASLGPAAAADAITDHLANPKVERLIQALQKVEPNDTRKVILDSLLATTEGQWLPFPTMIAAIEKAGVGHAEAPGRAQAALRDLSWQFKTYLPAEDLAGCTVAIDVLATRRRFGKETRYRLTEQGRAALAALATKRP